MELVANPANYWIRNAAHPLTRSCYGSSKDTGSLMGHDLYPGNFRGYGSLHRSVAPTERAARSCPSTMFSSQIM